MIHVALVIHIVFASSIWFFLSICFKEVQLYSLVNLGLSAIWLTRPTFGGTGQQTYTLISGILVDQSPIQGENLLKFLRTENLNSTCHSIVMFIILFQNCHVHEIR